MVDDRYHARVAFETGKYRDDLRVHDLPAAFHYWSNTYVRPKLRALGFDGAVDLFHRHLLQQCEARGGLKRFVSIGAGNCDFEIELASHLQERGHTDFVIDCLELSASMLERGSAAAAGKASAAREPV